MTGRGARRSAGARPRPAGPGTALAVGLVSAGGTRGVLALSRAGRVPGGTGRWERRNHRGDSVTLLEGPALAAGAALPLAFLDPPGALAVVAPSVAGAADDLGDDTATKGLRGHLGALRRGRVTTGSVKVGTLALTGLVVATWADRRSGQGVRLDTFAAAGLVAGAANLANLFDLRPGRALKVALATTLPLAARGDLRAAAAAGAGLAALPSDLAGRSMLGDTGANPLGALAGLALAGRLGGTGRWLTLGGVVALTLASERVSFTRVIETTPVLDALDRWGRPR